MTTVSPILKSRLEANNNHDKIYHHLTKHANDVKPNLPKAKLIRENTLQSAVSAVKDTFQDGKNFFKAAKTGKMNDNNLGRINDLGMKAGALLIASYLATHAKTKTDAIMQFIGGTTFFASMALWPKLFINLPARLVHGFKIDHKYLSAQGDKKDLGLDNQFQPMDIFTDEEMLDMAKKAGIDPNDEFAKEKMQRKLQKTMLQNRTLWMATAGVATPLMTSLAGNFIEPRVRKAVIDHDVKKVTKIVTGENAFENYMARAKAQVQNVEELKKLFKGLDTAQLDDDFYKQLTDMFDLNKIFEQFKDPDDIKPVASFKSENLIPVLKQLREDNSFISKDNLIETLSKMELPNKGMEGFLEEAAPAALGKKEAAKLLEGLADDKVSLAKAREIIAATFGDKTAAETIKNMQADNTQFFELIKEFNTQTLGSMKGRLKAYVDLLNPLIGSKSESAYTAQFNDTMRKMLKTIGVTDKDLGFFQKATVQQQQEFLSGKFQAFVKEHSNYFEILTGKHLEDIKKLEMTPPSETVEPFLKAVSEFTKTKDPKNCQVFTPENAEKLKTALTEIFGKDFYLVSNEEQFQNFAKYITQDNKVWLGEILTSYAERPEYQEFLKSKILPESELEQVINSLISGKNIGQIQGEAKGSMASLMQALVGEEKSKQGIFNFIQNFVKNKRIDLNATKFKPLIAANFEARLLSGEFEDLSKQQIQALRNIVYDGTISMRNNKAEIRNAEEYIGLVKRLFDPSAFLKESSIIPGFSEQIRNLRDIVSKDGEKFNTAKYFTTGSFSELIKNFGTRLNENKSWKKIFFPMAIGLVAVTLLVQPLFGKIEKEFPKKAKKEGVDNNGNK